MRKLFRVELEVEITNATTATFEHVDRRLRHALEGTLDDGSQITKVHGNVTMFPILDKVEKSAHD